MALLKPKDIASGMRPGHYVKLDSKGKLPPVDGSQLINLQLPKEEEIIERILEKLESEVSSRNFFRNPTGLSSPQEEPIEEEIELTFDEYVDEAQHVVNAIVENARQVYFNVGPFQMMVYDEKFQEASDYIVDNMPENLSKYPFIQIEAEVTGKSGEEIANAIIDGRREWISFNVETEKKRLIAKHDLTHCKTKEEVDVVIETLSTQLEIDLTFESI